MGIAPWITCFLESSGGRVSPLLCFGSELENDEDEEDEIDEYVDDVDDVDNDERDEFDVCDSNNGRVGWILLGPVLNGFD